MPPILEPSPVSRPTRRAALPALLALTVTAALAGLAVSAPAAVQGSPTAVPSAAADLVAARAVPARASRDRDRPAEQPPSPAAPPADEPAPPVAARPGDGALTSTFGPRWGRAHSGIDLAAGIGAPVRAAADGTVSSAGAEGGYGTTVRVQHADDTETVYAHLSSAMVEPGALVVAGQDVGREGNTGRSTGPHLHFEVRVTGVPVDPVAWLAARGVLVV